jgi:hypothetical protein
MSIASWQRSVPFGLVKQSYDVRFLVTVAAVAVGVVVAICALAAHQVVSPAHIGLMTAFP